MKSVKSICFLSLKCEEDGEALRGYDGEDIDLLSGSVSRSEASHHIPSIDPDSRRHNPQRDLLTSGALCVFTASAMFNSVLFMMS